MRGVNGKKEKFTRHPSLPVLPTSIMFSPTIQCQYYETEINSDNLILDKTKTRNLDRLNTLELELSSKSSRTASQRQAELNAEEDDRDE
jgi:hypothetical protein